MGKQSVLGMDLCGNLRDKSDFMRMWSELETEMDYLGGYMAGPDLLYCFMSVHAIERFCGFA